MALKKVSLAIKTSITYALWIAVVPLGLCLCALLALFPKKIRLNNRFYFVITTFLGWFIVKATFVRFVVYGKENIPAQPSLILANHTSALDIPLVELLVGSHPHIWMSKMEYNKIPIFGFILRRMHVTVDKLSGSAARTALLTMYTLLKEYQSHALIFPEGTRSADGKMLPLLAGFAILAQKLKRPIVPIVIAGFHQVYPKNSLLIDSSVRNVKISIGKPLVYQETVSLNDFVSYVQHYFEDELAKLNA